jgi:Kef-type K+ transport system membrane component KefB
MRFSASEMFLFALLIILFVPYSIWRALGRPTWIPLVVVQIVTGIILGPSIFGSAFQEEYKTIFSHEVISALNGIASWGVMMFVWSAGIEVDVNEAWRKRAETGIVATLALAVPFFFGIVAGAALLSKGGWVGPNGTYWQVLMGIGVACSATALPILVLFLDNLAILRTSLGQRILRYASLDDIAIWAVLSLILLDLANTLKQLGFFFFFIPLAIIVRRSIAAVQERDRWHLGLIWLALCGLAADWAGLHYMVGAFLSGVVLDIRWFRTEKVDAFRVNILFAVMPVYFLSTGLRTSWNAGGITVFFAAGLLLFSAVFGKLFAMRIAGKILGWSPGESSIIGWLLQTKALIMIIFSNILLDKHIISPDTFTALLLMAVGSTMFSIPMASPLLKKNIIAESDSSFHNSETNITENSYRKFK